MRPSHEARGALFALVLEALLAHHLLLLGQHLGSGHAQPALAPAKGPQARRGPQLALLGGLEHLVDEAVLLGFVAREVKVAPKVLGYLGGGARGFRSRLPPAYPPPLVTGGGWLGSIGSSPPPRLTFSTVCPVTLASALAKRRLSSTLSLTRSAMSTACRQGATSRVSSQGTTARVGFAAWESPSSKWARPGLGRGRRGPSFGAGSANWGGQSAARGSLRRRERPPCRWRGPD